MESKRVRVLVVGSGGNGISVAVKLVKAGIDDFRIVTRHDDFGGTWYQNTYPGCEVDTPTSQYQFGYQPKEAWSRLFAKQPEIADYMREVARSHGLYDYLDASTFYEGAEWSEEEGLWNVTTDRGLYKADFVAMATGYLDEPSVPDIPGMDTFEGRIFHSAAWPDGYTGRGDRIAVVGSGASAIQIVPSMQRVAESVTQFIRTPTWMIPKNNRDVTPDEYAAFYAEVDTEFEKWENLTRVIFLGADPAGHAELEKAAQEYMESHVTDPDLRAALTPDHRLGCKRPLISDDYYPSLVQSNVSVVMSGLASIAPNTVTGTDGTTVEVDTIVLATGFKYGDHVLQSIKRRDGRTVAEYQGGHARSYKGVSVAGCPNLFLIGGPAPNGQIWRGIYPGEIYGDYLVQAIQHMDDLGVPALEIREEVELEWKRQADVILHPGPTTSGGCVNYSLDQSGHNKALWPGTLTEMTESLRAFDPDAYSPVTPATRLESVGATVEN